MTNSHYAEPHQMPKQLNFTLYLTYGVGTYNRGRIEISDYFNKEEKKRKDRYDKAYEKILLSEFEITVDIPEGVDPSKRYLQVLKNQKRALLAQHHIELKSIDDQIARAAALEYKPVLA